MALLWSKHGSTTLLIPGHDPPSDITIFMDISKNPGPDQLTEVVHINEGKAIDSDCP